MMGYGHLRPQKIPDTSSFNERWFSVPRLAGNPHAVGVRGSNGNGERDHPRSRGILGEWEDYLKSPTLLHVVLHLRPLS